MFCSVSAVSSNACCACCVCVRDRQRFGAGVFVSGGAFLLVLFV